MAWWAVVEGEWCGNGSAITFEAGPGGGGTYPEWAFGGWCLTNEIRDHSWDIFASWIHMRHTATVGVSYAFGCFGYLETATSILRIAANGYYDYHNDYGY